MKEYIERAAVLESLGYEESRRGDVLPGSTFDIILKEPAADVIEVRHGRWERNNPDDIVVYCSQCMMPQDAPSNYCPSCGALMDEEDEHEAG